MRHDRPIQYQLDTERLAGEPLFLPDDREDEPGSTLGLHFDTLFDQNEDEAGERTDPATGDPYDNSTLLETDGLTDLDEADLDAVEPPDMVDRWIASRERQVGASALTELRGKVA